MNYFNLHTHDLNCPNGIISLFPEQKKEMINGKMYSMGIHPWYVNEESLPEDLSTIEVLAKGNKIVAIGECGLDKLKGIALDKQINIFQKQIRIAETSGLPLIIHCVKAFDELIQLKRKSRIEITWIIHGFKGSLEQAKQLTKLGFYLSFGKALIQDQLKMEEVFRQIPDDRFFMETDVSEIPIESIYARAGEIKGIGLEELNNKILQNRKITFSPEYRD